MGAEFEKHREEKVTKFDAARRQLHTAIRLFLAEDDVLSVHTLVSASHAVLRTLLKAKGKGSYIKDNEYIRPEHRNEFHAILNHPANFLKHADRDPEDVLTFNHWFGVPWLLDCCLMHQKLTGKLSRECVAFLAWFSVHHPEYLSPLAAKLVGNLIADGKLSRQVITKDCCLRFILEPSRFPLPDMDVYEKEG